jgi:hypothetical protein
MELRLWKPGLGQGLRIFDFGFKKNNVSALIISEQSRKLYFEVFGQALLNNAVL